MPEGAWHEVKIYVDTFINADGDERPRWFFDGPHCNETCPRPGHCFLRTDYWPPEFHEVPGVGDYMVRWRAVGVGEELEWQER